MKRFLTLLTLCLVVFTACNAKSEKQRFTDATVEATCMVFESGDVNNPDLEAKAKAIYKDHGFDVEDEAAMEAIAAKYQNDTDVQTAVQNALKECAGDLFGTDSTATDEAATDETTTEEAATDEAATEETTPVEEPAMTEEDKAATKEETAEVK